MLLATDSVYYNVISVFPAEKVFLHKKNTNSDFTSEFVLFAFGFLIRNSYSNTDYHHNKAVLHLKVVFS